MFHDADDFVVRSRRVNGDMDCDVDATINDLQNRVENLTSQLRDLEPDQDSRHFACPTLACLSRIISAICPAGHRAPTPL